MNILMLAQFYPPIVGGEEQHVRNLSRALAARGHELTVATLLHGDALPYELDGDVRVYRLRGSMQRLDALFSTGRQFAPPFPDPELVWRLRRVVARARPDIVHAHNWLVHAYLPLRFMFPARLVVTLHDYSFMCAQKRLMYRATVCDGPGVAKCVDCASHHYGAVKGLPTVTANWMMHYAERRAVDLFLPVSRAVAAGNQLARQRAKFEVLPNFVPDTIVAATETSAPMLATLPDGPFLLFVGDLTYDKGLMTLLDAYRGLDDPPPLVLIGRKHADTPTELPANVLLLENWPHAAVMAAWQRATIALMPSLCPDSCPTVAIEAMACGKPVIASRIGGLTDMVLPGRTGLLVAPGDVPELRAALSRLLADPEERERYGAAGKAQAATFQAGSVVPRIEDAYRRLLGDHASGGVG